jgi:hypothetical protein
MPSGAWSFKSMMEKIKNDYPRPKFIDIIYRQ